MTYLLAIEAIRLNPSKVTVTLYFFLGREWRIPIVAQLFTCWFILKWSRVAENGLAQHASL